MLNWKIFDVWSWHGTIGRGRYLATGLVLLALKYNIDRLLAAAFGYSWSIFNYEYFDVPGSIVELTSRDARFYGVLLLVALPFIWSGTVLTLRRLRDADWPLWLVLLFFLPFLNLIFFIILAVVPSHRSPNRELKFSSRIGRLIPESEFGSALFGILVTAILAVLTTAFSAEAWAAMVGGCSSAFHFFLD